MVRDNLVMKIRDGLLISSLFNGPLFIYGDGKQVRDVLYIDDLVRAFELVCQNIKKPMEKFTILVVE